MVHEVAAVNSKWKTASAKQDKYPLLNGVLRTTHDRSFWINDFSRVD